MQIRPLKEGRFANLLLAGIIVPGSSCDLSFAVTFPVSDEIGGTLDKT
jgi:hypothetical protein